MASTRPIQKNKETKQLVQNEGTIASRLRSSSKVIVDVKPSKSRREKCISKSLVEKVQTEKAKKKSSDSKPQIKSKDLSSLLSSKNQEQPFRKIESFAGGEPSSSNAGKRKLKDKPTFSHKEKANKKSTNEQPIYHIRCKDIEDTSTIWKCALCGKDLATEEEQEHPIQDGEDELQHYLFSSEGREELSSTVLPEVAVLQCKHVFHETCLSQLLLDDVTDPSCPICLSMS